MLAARPGAAQVRLSPNADARIHDLPVWREGIILGV